MKFEIPGELTSLNDFIKATNSHRFAGNEIKRIETHRAYVFASNVKQKVPNPEYPIHIHFDWYMKDRKKDIDNVAFAKKFILDGMVLAKMIENDSQKFVSGFSDSFYIDPKNPRTVVTIYKAK